MDVKPLPIIKVPKDTFTPYNAQATLHFYVGFWALYLPVTVHGRVSDIWRSYFAQALFTRIHANVGFLPRPIVVQDRNIHSYEADFNAEVPLYTKASTLVSYLINRYVKTQAIKTHSLVEIIEKLYIDMYERGVIEEQDVYNVQEWIIALLKVGYTFPPIHSPFIPEKSKNIGRFITLKYSTESILRERKRLSILGKAVNMVNSFDYKINFCNPLKYTLTFATADRHDGPRVDLSSTLLNLGQTFAQLGPKLWQTHPKIFSKHGRNFENNYPEVAGMRGMIFVQDRLSPPLKEYVDHSTPMNSNWPRLNSEFYLNDSTVMKIDAFICTFPASMCQIWLPLTKTIIFLPSHR